MNKPAVFPRRTFDELVIRYELEPSLKDVFVEGTSDQAVLWWVIKASSEDSALVTVFPIDEIDIPILVLQQYGLKTGNRSEVIALCLELEKKFGTDFSAATGIVDLDAYSIIEGDLTSGLLLRSDFSAIEMYLFYEKFLEKTLQLVFPSIKRSAKNVIDQIFPVLRELFLMRAANQSLQLGAEWIAPDKFLSIKNGNVEFRLDDYRRHYLSNSAVWYRRTEFYAEIESLRGKLSGDYRFWANGHDAIELLGLFLKTFYKKVKDTAKTDPNILVCFLTCSLEVADIRGLPMFKALLDRLASPNKVLPAVQP